MKSYHENKVSGIKIAYVGGGSRGWAWTLMRDLAMEPSMSGEVCLYDIDVEMAKRNAIIGNKLNEHPDTVGKWSYRVAETVKDAFTGADFIVMSILPGTFDEMESDVHEPEKYNIYQTVGDTTGPGGYIRTLRTIPTYVDYAKKIKEYCPNAWVINYTNPMTMCTRALYEGFPEIKAFGCCHEVFETQRIMTYCLKIYEGIENVDRSDIYTNVMGVNHFTWVDNSTWRGYDLMPLYARLANEYKDEGIARTDIEKSNTTTKKIKESPTKYFQSRNKIKFDLFLRYGVAGAAGDRHLAEFMPPWYLENPEILESKWSTCLTPVSYRKETLKKRTEMQDRYVSGEDIIVPKKSDEEAVKQMRALLGLEDFITNVNMPNIIQMDAIEHGRVVETNALFTTNEVRPLYAGRLPDPVHSMVQAHTARQEMIVKAAIERDAELAFLAFLHDPAVTPIGPENARRLFETMIKNTIKYLPGWKI